jgi:hypothetical protein
MLLIDIDRYWAGLNSSGPGSTATWWANRLRDGSWAAERRVGQVESERGRRLGEQDRTSTDEWKELVGVGSNLAESFIKFQTVRDMTCSIM